MAIPLLSILCSGTPLARYARWVVAIPAARVLRPSARSRRAGRWPALGLPPPAVRSRWSFEEFEGTEGEPRLGKPTPETMDAWKRLYARYVEASLAYAVLSNIERGDLPKPPSFGGLLITVPAIYPPELSLN